MRFRSAKWSSPVFVNHRGACFSVGLGIALAGPVLTPFSAHATMTITSLSYGGNPIVGTTAYFSSTNPAGVATLDTGVAGVPYHDPDPESGFPYGVVDISKTQSSDPSLSRALSFNVTSSLATITPPAGQTAVFAITIKGNNSTVTPYAPIAGLNGHNCVDGGCVGIAGTGLPVSEGGITHTYGIEYTHGTTINVQLYPLDICKDYASQASGVQAFGCDANGAVQTGNPAGTPAVAAVPLQLTWEIIFVDGAGAPQGAPADSGTFNLQFQSSAQPWNCPADLGNKYFPGDRQITMDTSGFGIAANTGIAPTAQLIVLGKRQTDYSTPASPVTTADFPTSNSFFFRTISGTSQVIGNFTNTTDGTDNTYTLGFMIRDSTGMISPLPASGTPCVQSKIQTADVNTFLKKSKCFIATAAYRSTDAAPVMMLREFRDEILLQTDWGTRFVGWYYSWSPPAAEWLMRHPHARFPVLQALVPVEVTAWLFMHPMHLTLLLVLAISAGGLGVAFALLMKATRRAGG